MKKIIIVICFFMILMFFSLIILDSLNHEYSDAPKKSDVIIMLGGGTGRMEMAATLYHDGFADFVIITPEIEHIYTTSAEFALELGIPREAIIEESEATSTYTNAIYSLEIMERKEFKSALIVTSDYHIKRTKMIFNRINDSDLILRYVAALGPNGERWYELPLAKNIWFDELYKLWGYRIGLYKYIDE